MVRKIGPVGSSEEYMGEKPAEECIDGCIYYKEENREDEFCCKAVEEAEAAFVQCEVSIIRVNMNHGNLKE